MIPSKHFRIGTGFVSGNRIPEAHSLRLPPSRAGWGQISPGAPSSHQPRCPEPFSPLQLPGLSRRTPYHLLSPGVATPSTRLQADQASHRTPVICWRGCPSTPFLPPHPLRQHTAFSAQDPAGVLSSTRCTSLPASLTPPPAPPPAGSTDSIFCSCIFLPTWITAEPTALHRELLETWIKSATWTLIVLNLFLCDSCVCHTKGKATPRWSLEAHVPEEPLFPWHVPTLSPDGPPKPNKSRVR